MEITAFIVAMILLYAIHLGRDVSINVRLLGTKASLEVSDQHSARGASLDRGHTAAGDQTDTNDTSSLHE